MYYGNSWDYWRFTFEGLGNPLVQRVFTIPHKPLLGKPGQIVNTTEAPELLFEVYLEGPDSIRPHCKFFGW